MPSYLSRLAGELYAPIRFLWRSPNSETYYLFLLPGIVLILVSYYRFHARGQTFQWKKFLSFAVPWRRALHRSVVLDFKMGLLNYYYAGILSGVVLLYFPNFSPKVTTLLGVLLGTRTAPALGPQSASLSLRVAYSLSTFLASDFAFFFVHYWAHRVPIFWEFHKIHHSAETLNPLTAYRGHPFNLLATSLFTIFLVGSVQGIFSYVYPHAKIGEITVRGVGIFIFACNLAGGFLRHSSVWLHFGRPLNRILYSPAHHQIHHSEDPRHWGKNLGGVLALWDWMAGTLYIPAEREELTYGLGTREENDTYNSSIGALYYLPFLRIWREHLKNLFSRTHPVEDGDLG